MGIGVRVHVLAGVNAKRQHRHRLALSPGPSGQRLSSE
jgi:hypothetical protein